MTRPLTHRIRITVDWTLHDTALIAAARRGDTARQIAAAIGCTRNAVIGRIHRLRIDGRLDPGRPAGGATARRPRLQVPGLAGEGAGARRNGRLAPDRVILRERQRLASNHALAVAMARARDEARSSPLAERFAEGFLGQTGRVGLAELGPSHCRYPIDQPAGPLRYCGGERLAGSSYCVLHHARCNDGFPKRHGREARTA